MHSPWQGALHPGALYNVSFEVLRNDLGGADEYVTAIKYGDFFGALAAQLHPPPCHPGVGRFPTRKPMQRANDLPGGSGGPVRAGRGSARRGGSALVTLSDPLARVPGGSQGFNVI